MLSRKLKTDRPTFRQPIARMLSLAKIVAHRSCTFIRRLLQLRLLTSQPYLEQCLVTEKTLLHRKQWKALARVIQKVVLKSRVATNKRWILCFLTIEDIWADKHAVPIQSQILPCLKGATFPSSAYECMVTKYIQSARFIVRAFLSLL